MTGRTTAAARQARVTGTTRREAVIASELAAWLRRERQARGWSVMEMSRRLCESAKANGDNSVPGTESICRNIRRWEGAKGGVSERYMLHYCKAFDIPPHLFDQVQAPSRSSSPSGKLPDSTDETVMSAEKDGGAMELHRLLQALASLGMTPSSAMVAHDASEGMPTIPVPAMIAFIWMTEKRPNTKCHERNRRADPPGHPGQPAAKPYAHRRKEL
jgi:hypothetical protein